MVNPPQQIRTEMEDEKKSEREAWLEIRSQILLRDHFRCQECGFYKHLEVHHIVPKSKGGTDDPENLVTLCQRCHSKKHGFAHRENKRRRHTRRNHRKKQKRWYNNHRKQCKTPEFAIGPAENKHPMKSDNSPEAQTRRRRLYEKWRQNELNQPN